MSVSYEVMVQKMGKWRNESVTDDKDDAISRAEESISRGKVEGVRVIEETIDDTTGDSREKVVFSRTRNAPPKKKKLNKKKGAERNGERRTSDRRRDKSKKKNRRSLGDLILIMCLSAVSIIAGAGLVICIISK
ncbi:MAG: hypothetical protein ACTSV1_02535 [Alphaproteobacteria bacterium]